MKAEDINVEVFDRIAKDYRKIHSDNIMLSGVSSDCFAEYKIKEVTKNVPPLSAMKILDLGCGDGISGSYFSQYFPNCKYSGYDASIESIRIANERKLEDCKFTICNNFNVPERDNTFDLIFISCVLHHVNSSRHFELLKECLRVARPGGTLIIFEHNPNNPLTRKVVRDCIFDKDAVLISSSKLVRSIKQLGIQNVKCRFTIFMPRVSLLNRLVFLEKYLGWLPLGGQYYVTGKK
jgi:ubiquinone/menaquinone biosynthesis C-methylase UbiE